MKQNTTQYHPSIAVVAGIILRNSTAGLAQCLIAKRPKDKHQGGLWEFPGGKIEHDETPEQALLRELKEELNIVTQDTKIFDSVEFCYPDKKVKIEFYLVLDYIGEAKGAEGQAIKWVNLAELKNYTFPQANFTIVDQLQSI